MQKKTAIRFAIGSAIVVVLIGVALTTRLFFATAQGPRILYGETVTGDIASAGDDDSWTFDGVRGDIILITVERTNDTLIPSVSLTDPDGILIVELAAQSATALTTQFTVGLQSGGTHTITVSGANNTSGTYALSLSLQEAGEPVDSNGTILVYGRTASSTISNDIYREYWSFRGVRGDVVDVSMVAISGDLDAFVSLISPEGNVIAVSDDDVGTQDAGLYSVRLESSGTYTIAARRTGTNFGEGGTTQGDYELTLTLREAGQTDSSATPAVLTQGRITRGRLTTDAPTALFSIEAQGVLALSLDMTDPSQIGTLSVMTKERALLHTVSGPSPLYSSVTLPGPDTYWIEISTTDVRNDAPVDFGLTVTPLTIAQRASRALYYDHAQIITADTLLPEAWHFYGKQGDLVTLDLAPFGPVLEGSVLIYAPDGTLVMERLIRDSLSQPLLLTATGQHEIVFAPSVISTGYEITLWQDGLAGIAFDQHADPRQVQPLLTTVSNSGTGTVEPFETDAWTVDITRPETWAFALMATNTNLPLVLALEAPDGSMIARTVTEQLTRTARLEVALPSAGRYRVMVIDLNGTDATTYAIAAQPAEGGALTARITAGGVITPTANYDTWTINATPGKLVTVRVEPQDNAAAVPDVYLIGPDGAVITSTQYAENDSGSATLSAYVEMGGRQKILVRRPPQSDRLVYHIVTDVTSTLDDFDIVELAASTTTAGELGRESAVDSRVPTPVQMADIIAPLLPAESPILQAARRAEVGITIRGEIDTHARYQAWEFTATAEQMLEFSVIALADTSGPDLMILDENNAVVAEKFVISTTSNYLIHRFGLSGTYKLLVKLDDGGRYTLWMNTLNRINERVPDVIAGSALGYGQTLRDQLGDGDTARSFVFFGQAGDEIVANALAVDTVQALTLDLSTVSAGVIATVSASDNTQPVILTTTLPESGLYQIDVSRAGVGAGSPVTFALHLSLERSVEAVNTAGGILETERTAYLSAAGIAHHWLVSGQAGERITIDVSSPSAYAAAALIVQLTDSSGTVFEQRQVRLGQDKVAIENILLPRSGIYQVLVSSTQGPGLYHIALTRDRTGIQDAERPIQYGETTGKVLTGENFLDVWTFAGSRGDTIAVAAHPVRGDDALLSLQLRSDNGQVVATVAAERVNGVARIDGVTLPATGHYSIAVGNLNTETPGNAAYDITLLLRGTSARSIGSTLRYGDVALSTFYVDDPVDAWVFEGQQNDVVSARISSDDSGLRVTMNLLSTDWHAASSTGQQQVLTTAEANDEGVTELEFVLPTSGTYTLTAQDSALHGGTYALELTNRNPIAGPAQSIRFGQTREGQITDLGVANAWQFEGAAGVPISITVIPDSRGDLSGHISLIGPDGESIAQATAPANEVARIEQYTLPYQGIYTLRVTRTLGVKGHTAGGYSIDIQQNAPGTQLPPTLAYGAIQSGTLDATTPARRWITTGQQGDTLRIRFERTSGNLDPMLRVYDLSGALITEMHGSENGRAEMLVPITVDNTYVIEAARYHDRWGATAGNYALVIERVYQTSAEQTEPTLAYGERVNGTTDTETRSNMWSFRGQAGDTIAASIVFLADDAPLALTLHDAAGNTLSSGQRTQNTVAIERYTLQTDAIYTIEVRRPGDAAERFSPYTLTLDLIGIASPTISRSGALLQTDRAITGQFNGTDTTHSWFFNGQATDTLSLMLLPLYGALDVELTLISPDGTQLFAERLAGYASTYETGQLFLPMDGVYMILVRNQGTLPDAVYRLALQSVQQRADAGVIVIGEDRGGTISSAHAYEAWHFTAQANTSISVRASRITGDLLPSVTLLSADNQLLSTGHTDKNGQTAINAFLIPEDGDYMVVVGRENGLDGATTGSYNVMVRNNPISVNAAEAQKIGTDRAVPGYIDGSSPQYYAFEAVADDVFAVSAQLQGSEHGPLTLAVETEAGRTLSLPVMSTGTETYIEALTAPYTGRYIVAVEGDQPAAFTLVVDQRSPEPQDNDVTRAFGFGQTLVEVISTPDTASYWYFSGTQGDTVTITLDTTGSNLRADAVLYSPNGIVAHGTENSDAGTGCQTIIGPLRFPESGDYVLTVGGWLGGEGNTSGRFTVRMDREPQSVSGSAGGMIALYDVAVNGGLIPDDSRDMWTFEGIAGEVVTVRTTHAPTNSTVALKLLDPDGDIIGISLLATDYQGAEIRDTALLQSGTYTVQVDAQLANDDPVEYELVVMESQQNMLATSVNQAHGIAYGETESGSMQADQLYDAWVFYGNAGDSIHSAVTSETDFAPTLYLLNPSGAILQGDTDAALESETLGTSGFYALAVENISGTPVEYTITLEQLASGAGYRGELVDHAEGTLTSAEPAHTWNVQVDRAGHYAIVVQPQTLNQIPTVTIHSTVNRALAESTITDDGYALASAYLEAGMSYSIVVSAGLGLPSTYYSLHVMPARAINGIAEIEFALPDVGRIDSMHITDEWQIASITEGEITVTVERISGNLLALVSLFDENGMLIRETEAGDDGRAELSVELTADTRYRIAVSRTGLSGGLTEGDYAIEVTATTTE